MDDEKHQPSFQLVPLAKVAQRLDRHPATVKRWANKGLIPKPLKVGPMYFWTEAALAQWLENITPSQF